MFVACNACHGSRDADPSFDENERAAHRAYQQGNRCPFIPRSEWDANAPPHDLGPGGENRCHDGDACPGAYARTLAADEVSAARRWRGELAMKYPSGITEALVAAIDFADQVHDEWEAEGRRLHAEDMKRARE